MITPDQRAVPPPPPVADIWGAALADGSGRHVPVRRHWPELAAALDAEVDAAGMVPDTGQVCTLCTSRGAPVCCCERPSPDTGQARELRVIHPRERDDMAAALHSAECDCGDRPHHERETGADYSQLATAAIKHARIAAGDTVEAPAMYRPCPCSHQPNRAACVAAGCTCHDTTRATDTTPDRLAWISEAGETAAAERQARYQETACARRPAEERPDA